MSREANMEKSQIQRTQYIGGVSCRSLADEFRTPLYVYDEEYIVKQAKAAVENFKSESFDTEVVYASKAFSSKALFKLLAGEGLGFDVVSGGELYCAAHSGADMSKVYFHGNNKSDEEIAAALKADIGYFVIDNAMECARLMRIVDALEKKAKALLRINPGISAHTHEYIMTAKPDSKFGIYIEDREHIEEVIDMLSASIYIEHAGFHSHIGSQIVEAESFERAIKTMVGFLAEMKAAHGLDGMELSVGGGFGIKYVEQDEPLPLGDMCKRLVKCAEEAADESGVAISKLITEPGRAMVGEAGYTIYTIGDMKKSGDKNYIFVDGGMSDNIRPALYDAEYSGFLSEKLSQEPKIDYCVAGKNCESGDVLIKSVKLPEAEPGDLLTVCSTGAYGYTMASNYNRLGRPAVVFAGGGKARLVIRRESYEEQYSLEAGNKAGNEADDAILFSKYHGCGNNFVIIEESELSGRMTPEDYSGLARCMCNVNTGVGADGMIVVRQEPALEMVFFNCDGSRAPMCGNGIRCFANFCRDKGIASETLYAVRTLAGDMIVDVTSDDPFRVKINMGKPTFAPEDISVDFAGESFMQQKLCLQDGTDVEVSSFFMGTVHTVIFTDDADAADIPKIGEEICNHPIFREKTNVNFVEVIDEKTIRVSTYERGVGMTLACGTGACASVVEARRQGFCGSKVEVKLQLGSLYIEVSEDGSVYMEGPSVKITDGKFCLRRSSVLQCFSAQGAGNAVPVEKH